MLKKKIAGIAMAACMAATMAMGLTASAEGWVELDKGVVYEDENGNVLKSQWLTIGDNKYYLKSNGVRMKGWMETSNGVWYFFDNNGVMQRHKWITGATSGRKYYVGQDGKMVAGKTLEVDKGVKHKFDVDGMCLGIAHALRIDTENKILHGSKNCKALAKQPEGAIKSKYIGEDEFWKYRQNKYKLCTEDNCISEKIEDLFDIAKADGNTDKNNGNNENKHDGEGVKSKTSPGKNSSSNSSSNNSSSGNSNKDSGSSSKNGPFALNPATGIYHKPGCYIIQGMTTMPPIARDSDEAEAHGYKPCKACLGG